MKKRIEVINIDEDKDDDYDCCIVYTFKSPNSSTSKSNATSVDQYIVPDKPFIDLTQASRYTDDELEVPRFNPKKRKTFEKGESSNAKDKHFNPKKRRTFEKGESSNAKDKQVNPKKRRTFEKGESSNAKDKPFVVCEFCVEPKSQNEFFKVKGCSHAYCNDCTAKYIASKLQENITSIKCPALECNGKLLPEDCRPLLPSDVFDRWGTALCEAVILASEKFYCPYKDCSAMLVNDGKDVVKESECPNCYRLFCAQCKVPWHTGIGCEELQKLGENERDREDIMLKKLADSEKWSRCPRCKFYVQRKSGCSLISCRCGQAFCYRCGQPAGIEHDYYRCIKYSRPSVAVMPPFFRRY